MHQNNRELAVLPVGPGIDTEAVEHFLETNIHQERDHFQRNARAVKLRRYLNGAELAQLCLGPGTLLTGTRLSDGGVMWALYPSVDASVSSQDTRTKTPPVEYIATDLRPRSEPHKDS